MSDTKKPPQEVSEPELKVLRAIRDFTAKNGVAPSYENIAEATGRGKSTIRHTIDRLIRKGLLERTKWYFRGLALTPEGFVAAANGRKNRTK